MNGSIWREDKMIATDSAQSVLVVDDDPDILTALQDLLEFEGFHVDCAQTCREALRSIERNDYNAVLLDLGLPDGDGQSVLQKLQESDPSLPVIVLTAATSMDRRVGSLTQGAFAHLTKPYHREELRAILQRAIGMQSLTSRAEGFAVALSESEDRFRSLVESAPDAIIVADAHGYIVSWNQAAMKLFQYTTAEVLGKPLTILMPMRYREAHEIGVERMRTTGHSKLSGKVVSLHGLRKDGQEFPIELSLATWAGQGGTFYSGIIRDISVRTSTEAALRDNQDRFQILTEHLPQVFWMTDPAKNQLLYVSPFYARLWGKSCEELYRTPRSWVDAIHPEDRARVFHAAMTKQAIGTYREEYRILRPDGTMRWIRDQAFPIRDASGAVYRVAGFAEDITHEKEWEQAMRQSEERVQLALASADLGIWDWDCAADRIYCSGRTMSFLGQAQHGRSLSGQQLLALVSDEDRAGVAAIFTAWEHHSDVYAFRHRVLCADGSRQWLAWSGSALRGKDGTVLRVVGSVGVVD
jgi:PAS domain S-box-containing protein